MHALQSFPYRRHQVPTDRPRGIQNEGVFLRMLAVERKRSERVGQPFLLMLLNVENVGVSRRTVRRAGEALASAIRDTDIAGWYRVNSVLGVIFTALNGCDRENIRSVLFERTYKILRQEMDSMKVHRIQISFHFFPEEKPIGSPEGDAEVTVCLEAQKSELSQKLLAYWKRAFDISGALAGLIIASPAFLLIALLIKLSSPGPVLFRQKRVGQYGREFLFLKFRSMVINNDASIHENYTRDLIAGKVVTEDGTFKLKNDPRVTTLGRFLRKTSLDELPQLINVLKGEMSLVGPRPPIPYEAEAYKLWHQRRIQQVKPGITGLWQVTGRSRTTFDEMVRLDLFYIEHQSIWLDLKILLKTPLVVIIGDGAL